jgi:hypothetical protein
VTHHQPSWSAGRVVALVVCILTLLGGLAFMALGVTILAVDSDKREGDFLTSDETSLATSGYAVTADGIDIDELPSDSLFGRGRLRVTGSDADADVFVGVAGADDVAEYLAGVEHSTVTEIADPDTRYTDHPGEAPASRPGDLDIWVAQASGTGTQMVTWPIEEGRWAIVVMNAEATAGVDVNADVGVTAPWVRRIAAAFLTLGALATLTGGVLIFAIVRRTRRALPATRRIR